MDFAIPAPVFVHQFLLPKTFARQWFEIKICVHLDELLYHADLLQPNVLEYARFIITKKKPALKPNFKEVSENVLEFPDIVQRYKVKISFISTEYLIYIIHAINEGITYYMTDEEQWNTFLVQ